MVAYLFLTQDILVRFQMRPIIYCDTNGLSIMGHSVRINVGSNPTSRTEQLVELMKTCRFHKATSSQEPFLKKKAVQSPMWSRWLWQGSFKSLTRVRVPTLEFRWGIQLKEQKQVRCGLGGYDVEFSTPKLGFESQHWNQETYDFPWKRQVFIKRRSRKVA